MTSAPVVTTAEPRYSRSGRITHIERIRADQNPRFGIGTVVGTVAGGLLGHQFGGGSGQTVATIAGAAAGGAVGTLTESKLNKQEAYRITVDLRHGGTVVIVQPPDPALRRGMAVRIEGSGENARVVPG